MVEGSIATKIPQVKQIPENFALLVLRGYKFFISPWLGSACRFQPSCSDYAMQAIGMHGTLRGSMMAVGRILRCHPFSAGGYDPVRPSADPLLQPGCNTTH